MRVCETFASLQGESTHAGRKCFFIRLAGCNLDCSYCDTRYARSFEAGAERSVESLVDEVLASGLKLAEITGGEPLCSSETPRLCQALIDNGIEVACKTGSIRILRLLPEGKSRMSAEDFIRGRKINVGDILE